MSGTTVNSSKGANGHTLQAQSPGSKQIKIEHLASIAQPADLHKAPPSRVYSRDYRKIGPDLDANDLISPVLGNPLRW